MAAVNTKNVADKRGRSMKRLALAILVAALAYSAFWAWSARTLKSDIAAWFDARAAEGWTARYDDLALRGFPNRTDATLTGLSLASPSGEHGWSAPFFQILSLSYRSGHVILAWPDEQNLRVGGRKIELSSDGLRASLVHDDGVVLRSHLEAAYVNVAAPDGSLALAEVNAAFLRQEATPADYRLALTVGRLATPRGVLPAALSPEDPAAVKLDLVARFDRPFELSDLHGEPPQPSRITLRLAEYRYRNMLLKLAGALDVDRRGNASGDLTLRIENWHDLVDAAEADGSLPPSLVAMLRNILGLAASLNGDSAHLDLEITLDEGQAWLGPIPVGRIPPILLP